MDDELQQALEQEMEHLEMLGVTLSVLKERLDELDKKLSAIENDIRNGVYDDDTSN
jgi:hypothetical protein